MLYDHLFLEVEVIGYPGNLQTRHGGLVPLGIIIELAMKDFPASLSDQDAPQNAQPDYLIYLIWAFKNTVAHHITISPLVPRFQKSDIHISPTIVTHVSPLLYLMFHFLLSLSYHIISCHIHIISYRIVSFHVMSSRIVSCHIISYRIVSFHVMSYHFMSDHLISYRIIYIYIYIHIKSRI